jgi:putative FmdB family regulatory protein
MPLYEYQCRECRESFEVLQRLGDGPEGLACPKCGGSELSKQYSTFAASSTSGSSQSIGGRAPGCGTGVT